MIHSYKKIVCAALVGASFVACSFQSFSVSAIDISVGEQAGIFDYTNAGQQGLINIDFQFDQDEDGNRSKRLKIYALQNFAFSETFGLYDDMDFSAAPSTVTFGGYGTTGFYRLTAGGALRRCSVFTFPDWSSSNFGHVFISADDYTFYLSTNNPSNSECICYNDNYNGQLFYEFQTRARFLRLESGSSISLVGSGIGLSINDWMTITPNSMSGQNGWSFRGSDRGELYVPVYSSVNPSTGFPNPLFALGVNYTLPTGTVDTSTPWNYYNNVLLPYMEQEFPGYEQYFVFPDGYAPVEPTEPSTIPIEYPTAPTMDLGLIEEGTQPAGMETAAYELPEIETKSIGVPVFDLSAMDPGQIVAPVSNGLSGLWALISDLLNSFGLMPLVTLTLFVLVIGALLTLGR